MKIVLPAVVLLAALASACAEQEPRYTLQRMGIGYHCGCPDCAPCHADYLLEISNRYVCK